MISFTKEALQKLTLQQRDKLVQLAHQEFTKDIEVSVDFSLPNGYVAVIVNYQDSQIYGGIDSEGVMST